MFCSTWMLDSTWQMASLGGHWFICLDSSECCGGVNTSWDTCWDPGKSLVYWVKSHEGKGGGMLGDCLPQWGEALSRPSWVMCWPGIELTTFWFLFLLSLCALIASMLLNLDVWILNTTISNKRSQKSRFTSLLVVMFLCVSFSAVKKLLVNYLVDVLQSF